jgi:hypothetical protein
MNMPRLENWSLIASPDSPYEAPELKTAHLLGKVFNHHRFKDGELVRTSALQGRIADLILTASGSLYELGEPDENYDALYPDVKNRLMKNLRSMEP